MVALVAAVGAFTSCKDYDDDINDLRSQINGLNTSLSATIDSKIATVNATVNTLSTELEKVKAAYAAADEALNTQLTALKEADKGLQGNIDANKANIAANLQSINDLKQEVANLYATKASLEAAKTSLENALKEANDLIKKQGESIAALVAQDQALEKGINEAKELAGKAKEAADAAQKAADKVAGELSTLSTKEATDVTNLQKQITENLTSLTKKIEDADAALDKRVTANTTSINDLSKEVAKNYATLVYVDAKIKAVEEANAKVAADLKTAQENLAKAIKDGDDALAAAQKTLEDALKKAIKDGDDANAAELKAAKAALEKAIKDGDDANAAELKAAKAALEKAIKDGDDANAAALLAAQLELAASIKEVSDKADATATALAVLKETHAKDIENLTEKLDADMKAFVENVVGHIIPDEVAEQVPVAIKKFYDETIKPYVDKADQQNATLLENLTARFEADSIKLAGYLAGEYLLAIQKLINDSANVVRGENATTAKALKDAYEEADRKIYEAIAGVITTINDTVAYMNDANKEGTLAALLKAAKEDLQGQIDDMQADAEEGSLAWRIDNIEKFFEPADAAELNVNNLADKMFVNNEEVIRKLVSEIVKETTSLDKLADNIVTTTTFITKIEVATESANDENRSMITSINLFAGPHNYAHYGQDGIGYDEFDHTLTFTYAIEKNNVFPDSYNQAFVDDSIEFKQGFLHTYGDAILVRVSPVNAELSADKIALINSQGQDVIDEGIIAVTSVERYTAPAGSYLTRASNLGKTGLWVIKFEFAKNNADVWANFKQRSVVNVNGTDRNILYAVGVRNTDAIVEKAEGNDTISDGRYVVSEYDLDMETKKAFHIWDYNVNDKTVAEIHNRYVVNENKPNSPSAAPLWTDDKANYPDTYWQELTYAPYVNMDAKVKLYNKFTPDVYEPGCGGQYPFGEEVIDDREYVYDIFGEKIIEDYPGYTYAEFVEGTADDEEFSFNVTDRYNHKTLHSGDYNSNGIDNRHNYKILAVKFNRTDATGTWADIDIEFPEVTCGRHTQIAGFYVTLDQKFADESNSSEVTSWTSYWYEGVGFYCVNGDKFDDQRNDAERGIVKGIRKATLFKGSKGTISIKDYNSAKGDVIGFRVYAVNLDGTLYDPDGRAFYVKVGDDSENHNLAFFVEVKGPEFGKTYAGDTATNKTEDIVAYNKVNKNNKFFNIKQTEINKGNYYTIDYVWGDNNPLVAFDGGVQPVADSNTMPSVERYFNFTFTSEATVAEANEAENGWKQWYEIATGTIAEPYADIQHVKVTLINPGELVDGATYKVKAIVKLHEADGTDQIVNIINIDVTKVMPISLPAAFRVRGATGTNAIKYDQTVFLRTAQDVNVPNNGNIRPWNIDWFDADDKDSNYGWNKVTAKDTVWASDARPYGFEEMFAGMMIWEGASNVDPNYTFVFEGCGDFADNKKDGDAVSTYNADGSDMLRAMSHYGLNQSGTPTSSGNPTKQPRYTVPYVHNQVMDLFKTEKVSVKAGYTYRGISYNPDKNIAAGSDWKVAPDYFDSFGKFTDKDKAAFKVSFKCALDYTEKIALNYPMTDAATTGKYVKDCDTLQVIYEGVMTNNGKGYEIPYGHDFYVLAGKVNGKPTLTWVNKLPTYVDGTTPGASYFRTSFSRIPGNHYYGEKSDTIHAKNEVGEIFAKFRRDSLEITGTKYANTFGLINVDVPENGYNELQISSITYKVDDADPYTLDLAGLKDFYNIYDNVTYNDATHDNVPAWYFKFLDNTLMPTNWHYIEITFDSKPTKYALMTQWGHKVINEASFKPENKSAVVIKIKNPAASPEIQSARRNR